jgi:ABC-type transporter Mla subunit MlaD
MAKRKKQSKIEVTLAEFDGTFRRFERQLESETSTRRIAESSVRDVISAQTTRLEKLTQRLNETVGQTNAGFQVAQSNTNTAARALSAHDGQIASLTQRIAALEAAATAKPKGKR